MNNAALRIRAKLPASANATQGCPVCKNLQPGSSRYESKMIELKSLRNKCGYCQLLKSALARFAHGHPTCVWLLCRRNEPIRITYFRERDQNSPRSAQSVEFILYAHEKSQLVPELGTLSPYPTSTELDASISFINEQLKKCRTQHKACRRRPESPLPTRVLSIGSSDSDVRLVESKNVLARYVTLSHCWGDKQPARTTASNFDDMKKSVNVEALPIVFQQAISIARMLKVEYIWIDSLCIIQDSQSDWELESVQMCDYYENSFLTISTAASPDPTVPFLGPRDERWWPVQLELATSEGREHVYAQHTAKTSEEQGQLFSRAWAWQEAAMSTHTIHFTPSQLIWECLKEVIPQVYVSGLSSSDILGFSKVLSSLRFANFLNYKSPVRPVHREAPSSMDRHSGDTSSSSDSSIGVPAPRPRFLSTVSRFFSTASRPSRSRSSSSSSSSSGSSDTDMMSHVWDMWDQLVEYYSRRQLTFVTDKLPALSGVASRVHQVTQSRYLAGMWEENLALNLCWTRADVEDQDMMSLPTEYVAPSWSWVSILAGVEPEVERTIETFEPSFTIVEAYCHVPGLNPFGRVSAGHLVLRGKVAELTLTCEHPHRLVGYELSGPLEKWHFYPDSALVSSNGDVSRARQGQAFSKFRAKVLGLYVGSTLLKGDRKQHYMIVMGNSENDKGSFCRIGLACSRRNWLFNHGPEMEVRLI